MRARTKISERRACALMGLSRTVLHYAPCPQPRNDQLRVRIQQLAAERRRFGYRRIHALLRREGVSVNVKRVHRLYCEDSLQVRRRRRRRGAAAFARASGAQRSLVHRFRDGRTRTRPAAEVPDDR